MNGFNNLTHIPEIRDIPVPGTIPAGNDVPDSGTPAAVLTPATAIPISSVPIRFTLNGKETVYDGPATARLLDVLRDTYRCTSVKCGCKEGECGACSVLLNGTLINSCCVAMGAIYGSEVVTLEGYRETARFAALDKGFAATAAVQCGFCIPGMVLAAESILAANPHPTEEEIRIGISGNLCRCTGYNAIVKAIRIASEEGEGLW